MNQTEKYNLLKLAGFVDSMRVQTTNPNLPENKQVDFTSDLSAPIADIGDSIAANLQPMMNKNIAEKTKALLAAAAKRNMQAPVVTQPVAPVATPSS